jgi:hypothetical protein
MIEESATRIVEGHGLVEARLEHCVQALGDEKITVGRSTLREIGRVTDANQALAFFSTYTFPATRHILFPAGDGWTGVVNNSKNGSDFNDYTQGWCRALKSRTLRLVDSIPVVWKKGDLRVVLKHEARIVEFYDESARTIRAITCADDGGRWTWHVSGNPLPIEAQFRYGTRRIKDRFARRNLQAFLASIPAPVVDGEAFLKCTSFSLVEETYKSEDWMRRIRATACNESELGNPAHGYYQRGLGWMEHLATHSSSAIADFEKALRIDPSYESRIRPHLDRAYEIAGGPSPDGL